MQLTSIWACAGDVVLAMGKRPGTAQGLAAAKQASGLGYASRASIALTDLSNRYHTLSGITDRGTHHAACP